MIYKMIVHNKVLGKMKFRAHLMVNKMSKIKKMILKKLKNKKLVLIVYISFYTQNNLSQYF